MLRVTNINTQKKKLLGTYIVDEWTGLECAGKRYECGAWEYVTFLSAVDFM